MELEDKYLLDESQREAFIWLKQQDLGVDHDIIAYWARIVPLSTLMSCIPYAKTLKLKNTLKYIEKYLKTDTPRFGNAHMNQDYIMKISEKYPEMGIKVNKESIIIKKKDSEHMFDIQCEHKYFINCVNNIL
jgi:hypothetical protein